MSLKREMAFLLKLSQWRLFMYWNTQVYTILNYVHLLAYIYYVATWVGQQYQISWGCDNARGKWDARSYATSHSHHRPMRHAQRRGGDSSIWWNSEYIHLESYGAGDAFGWDTKNNWSIEAEAREKNKIDVFDRKELNISVRFYIYTRNMIKFI
jgi:hypothetical protein